MDERLNKMLGAAMNRHAKRTLLASLILVIASCSKPSIPPGALRVQGYLSDSSELDFQSFKFHHMKRERVEDGEPWIGVFTFRYKYPVPLEFSGYPGSDHNSFIPQYTTFMAVKSGGWQQIGPTGFCGTGARSSPLDPGVDYQIEIPLYGPAQPGMTLQVSLDSRFATFWSEPFTVPRR